MALNFIKSRPNEVLSYINKDHYNTTNCSLHAIDEYPNWFTDEPPRWDFIFYCSVLSMYLFLAIAIVCNDFCIPAVERICYNYGLSYDVAGATLMALATSSPEFFINLYATFLTEGDLGIGTIVGSSVFNTLFVPVCCCLLTGVDFYIDWWPITRDLLWYSYAVLLLTCFLWFGQVMWWKSLILVAMYFVNLGNLLLDREIQDKIRDYDRECKLKCFVPLGEVKDFEDMEDPDDDEEPFDFKQWPEDSYYRKFMWIIQYPLQVIFALTIPDVQRTFFHKYNFCCFVMSTIWLSFLTYLCSWLITVLGYHLFVPDSVMGLVVLAAGTSVPEAISSVIVTKKGYGSMAICNAVGSNTVDIFICLGAPWLVKAVFFPSNPEVNAISVASHGLPYTSAALLISALLLYFAFMFTRFHIGKSLGIMCLIVYTSFITVAVINEMIHYDDSTPHCPHKKNSR